MTALITGGSSGMGLEFARQLAGKGYDIILVSNREEELNAASESLRAAFPVAVTAHFQDLACEDAAQRLYSWCREEAGVLPDIVVNDAGMFFFKELEAADWEKVRCMLELHVVTVTHICLLFSDAMKKRGVAASSMYLPWPPVSRFPALPSIRPPRPICAVSAGLSPTSWSPMA